MTPKIGDTICNYVFHREVVFDLAFTFSQHFPIKEFKEGNGTSVFYMKYLFVSIKILRFFGLQYYVMCCLVSDNGIAIEKPYEGFNHRF